MMVSTKSFACNEVRCFRASEDLLFKECSCNVLKRSGKRLFRDCGEGFSELACFVLIGARVFVLLSSAFLQGLRTTPLASTRLRNPMKESDRVSILVVDNRRSKRLVVGDNQGSYVFIKATCSTYFKVAKHCLTEKNIHASDNIYNVDGISCYRLRLSSKISVTLHFLHFRNGIITFTAHMFLDLGVTSLQQNAALARAINRSRQVNISVIAPV